jgi:hypothetical protein
MFSDHTYIYRSLLESIAVFNDYLSTAGVIQCQLMGLTVDDEFNWSWKQL